MSTKKEKRRCFACQKSTTKYRHCKSHVRFPKCVFCADCYVKCDCGKVICYDCLDTCIKCSNKVCGSCYQNDLQICVECNSHQKCEFCDYYIDGEKHYCSCCSNSKLDVFCASCIQECENCFTTGCSGCGTVNDCMECNRILCQDCMGNGACNECDGLHYCDDCTSKHDGKCEQCYTRVFKAKDYSSESENDGSSNETIDKTNFDYVTKCKKGNVFTFNYLERELGQFVNSIQKGNSIITKYDRKNCVKRADITLGDVVVYSSSLGGGIMVGRIVRIEKTKFDLNLCVVVLHSSELMPIRGTIREIDPALVAKVGLDGDKFVSYKIKDSDKDFETFLIKELVKYYK